MVRARHGSVCPRRPATNGGPAAVHAGQDHLILCDADLDHFGREDFFKLDGKLREGRRIRGLDVSDEAKWYRGTLEIISKHQYYTDSQKKLRENQKQKNIKKLLKKLEDIEKKK